MSDEQKLERERKNMALSLEEMFPAELPKTFQALSPVEMAFVTKYVVTGDAMQSYKDAAKSYRLSLPKGDDAVRMLVNRSLLNPIIKQAEKELRNLYVSEATNRIAKTGTEVSKEFERLSNATEAIQRNKARIKRYDELIESAFELGDVGLERQLINEQLNLERRNDKLIENARKNLSIVNEISGDSKAKQIIKAGSISINVGNTVNAKDDMKKIDLEDAVEMIDLKELED